MILAFVGQKGGTGKSTLAICVATELSARGRRVLLVDADPQATVVTWHDVATERGHAAPTVIAMNGTLHEKTQLPQLAAGYEDVVIDTAGDLGKIQRSAMMVADLAILPCGPTAPDAWALKKSIETVEEAREYRPELGAVLLINKIRAGTAAARAVGGARDALASAGLPILRAELGLRQSFVDALAVGQGVTAYAPKEPAADEVRALVSELREMEHGKEGKARARGQGAEAPAQPRRLRAGRRKVSG